MSNPKFNFNLIVHKDLRKFLTKKMESEKWEFSSALEATLAHHTYNTKMAYGFILSKNMKIILKRVLNECEYEFALPFLYFNKRNMEQILEENSFFFDQGLFYLKSVDSKKESINEPVKNIEDIQRLVTKKYKTAESYFTVEKINEKIAVFQGEPFDVRLYVMVVKMNSKYYTFSIQRYFVILRLKKLIKLIF